MKKRILLLAIFVLSCFVELQAHRIHYICNGRGRVEIYIEVSYNHPVTGAPHTSLVYCCSGGGCPAGERWRFSITYHKPTANDWALHEATENDYSSLESLAAAIEPPTQSYMDSLMVVLLANPSGEKWVDPLKIDQGLANDLGLYSAFEIYAPTVYENPVPSKQVKFDLRSNTGNTILVSLENSTTNAIVYSTEMEMDLGSNKKEFTVSSLIAGTYILTLESKINTIRRTVIIQ